MTLTKFKKKQPVFSPFFENIFDSDFFDIRPTGNFPSANVKEKEDRFEVELAIPGFDKNDVKVELNDGLLTISSEKEEENEAKDGRYSRREFNYASFSRSFRLPDNIHEDHIEANFKNGVLVVEIPKAQEVKKVKAIEIK